MRNKLRPMRHCTSDVDTFDNKTVSKSFLSDFTGSSGQSVSVETNEKCCSSEKNLKLLERKQKAQLRQRTAMQLREIMRRNGFVLCFEAILSNLPPKLSSINVVLKILRQEGGLIPAQHILAMAENSSVLIDIGCWMVREILCLSKGLPPYISFAMPVSFYQLQSQKFVTDVGVLMNLLKANEGCLQFVVSKETIEKYDENLAVTIKLLTEIGVRFSVNHVEKNSISWASLSEKGVSTVLLEQHLTIDATEDLGKQKLLKRFVKEARKNNLKLRAVGIDSTSLAKLCLRIGIDEIQGPVIASETPLIHFGVDSGIEAGARPRRSIGYRLLDDADAGPVALGPPVFEHEVGIRRRSPRQLLRG